MAEIADPAVFVMLVAGQQPEGWEQVSGLLDLSGYDDGRAESIELEHCHHPGVKSRLTARILDLSGN